jgi:hypothetical protein
MVAGRVREGRVGEWRVDEGRAREGRVGEGRVAEGRMVTGRVGVGRVGEGRVESGGVTGREFGRVGRIEYGVLGGGGTPDIPGKRRQTKIKSMSSKELRVASTLRG